MIFVAETFTGGLISVSGSPISSSGTLGLTVAGVSGGIPYFSSGSTWASSAALTANSLIKGGGIGVAPSSSVVTEVGGILSTGTDFVSIAPVGLSANGALSVSPTNIGTIAGNFNCANGLTVDCFDVSIGGSKQIFVDKNGTLNLGSSLNTQPELIFASGPAPSDCNGTPPYPCIGGQWFVGPQMQYQDTNNTTQTYIVSNLNNILVGAQTFRASGPGDVPFTGQTAANPTVNGWQILDSNGVPQAYLCTSTAQANCTVPFTLFAAGFQVLGPAGVATIIGYSAGTSPGILSNKVGRIGPAVLTGTGYNVAEPGVEPTAGQVQTIVGCTAHDCTSSYQTPSGGGGGGTPGGSPGNLQYNNAGAFGGFTDGSSTQVLHGGRTFGLVVNADIAAATIDLSTKVTGLLPAADMPALTGDCTTIAGAVNITCANLNGIAYSATAAAHSVEVITTANTTATAKVIPDCTDSAGNHLNYTQSGDTFSCGTSSSGGGGGGTGVGRFSGVIDFPSIPDGACSAQTFTATGTATSDVVTVGWPSALNAGLVGNMFVSASNTITVRLCNLSGAAIDPASLTYKATLAVYNLSGSGTIDFASIPDGGCLSNTFTLTGTAAGDPVVPGWPSTLNTGLFGSMIASATDTIQVRLCNLSGAAIDPASLVYKASIAK